MTFVFAIKDTAQLIPAWENFRIYCARTLFTPRIIDYNVEDLVNIYDIFAHRYMKIIFMPMVNQYYDPVRVQLLKSLLLKMDQVEANFSLEKSTRTAIRDLKEAVKRKDELAHKLIAVGQDNELCFSCKAENGVHYCNSCYQTNCLDCHGPFCVAEINTLVKDLPFGILHYGEPNAEDHQRSVILGGEKFLPQH